MFDVKTITEVSEAEVEILHPITGEGLGAFVTLAGPEHPDRKSLEFARQRKVRAEVQRSGKYDIPEPEDYAEDQTEKLVACTLGWREFARDGQPIDFSKAEARAMFGSAGMTWMRDQLLAALEQRTRFIKTSVTS